jgi:hypothetical protein
MSFDKNNSGPGVSDFILLKDLSEDGLLKNMKKRWEDGFIYTYIGNVIVSVNPYQHVNLYSKDIIELYRTNDTRDLPPHIYSLADITLRTMKYEAQDQCIIISGESGSGKTEASKLIMEYIATIAGKNSRQITVEHVKDQLLNSNPVLEAFGNAKTVRNDNSSRFGKYMDLQFDGHGNPSGGKINTYLLEKSRVVTQQPNERNFHIFYQLLNGAEPELREHLKLKESAKYYKYLNETPDDVDDTNIDKDSLNKIINTMNSIGISDKDQLTLLEGIAAILHLGNIKFEQVEGGSTTPGSKITNMDEVEMAAELLGIEPNALATALISRTINDYAGRSKKAIIVPLDLEKAEFSRDALAKALYSYLFDFLIQKVNDQINKNDADENQKHVIGVLDIYGFEIFEKNSFEQLIINTCNEKLHQHFINYTLLSEREEYKRAGYSWDTNFYFSNQLERSKEMFQLIESKDKGIFALLDEECLMPVPSTTSFLNKLDYYHINHKYYDSCKKTRSRRVSKIRTKSFSNGTRQSRRSIKAPMLVANNTHESEVITHEVFWLKHYAGEVDYSIDDFVEKNNDTLHSDLVYALHSSEKEIFKELIPKSKVAKSSRVSRTPDTLGMQFRNSLTNLMKNVTSKTPHYIRCIKPNTTKSSIYFDESLCLAQCRYLGLLENIRARRQLPKYAVPIIQRTWRSYRAHCLLNGMKKSVIKSGNDWINIKWEKEPANEKLKEAFNNLKYIYYREMAKKYRQNITPERKALLDWKLSASILFKDKKKGYSQSIQEKFIKFASNSELKTPLINKKSIQMSLPIKKIHRRNTKKQVDRSFILTSNSIYILTSDNSKIKDLINFTDISSISTSPLNDNIMILHVKNSSKGDLMLSTEENTATKIISVISYIWMLARKRGIRIPVDITDEINMKCYSQTCKFVFREADRYEASSDNELQTKPKTSEVKNRRRAKSFAANKFQNTTNPHKRNVSISGGNFNTISRVQS